MYYDKTGTPIDRDTWLRFFDNHEYSTVGYTKNGKDSVSTIYTGLDHNIHRTHAPQIFESLVMYSNEHGEQEVLFKYTTQADAEAGHRKLVEEYLGIQPEPQAHTPRSRFKDL